MTSVLASSKMERLPHKSGTTAKLAVESKRMEDRLRMLKQMMSAEKARREAEGGLHWQSGAQHHPATHHPATHQQGKGVSSVKGRPSKKPLRVKLLTDDKSLSSSSRANLPKCGQCEKSTATLCCVECTEKYCQLCFAKFHQKGALSLHHVKPLLNKKNSRLEEIKSKPPVNPLQPRSTSQDQQTTVSGPVQSSPPAVSATSCGEGGSLLEGSYDEEESAASFQQALAEWRAFGGENKTTSTTSYKDSGDETKVSSSTSTATQAGAGETRRKRGSRTLDSKDIGVCFSNKTGVSYFEKLVMRRHRYDPLYLTKAAANDDRSGSAYMDEDDDEESFGIANERSDAATTPSEYNIFYGADSDEMCLSEEHDLYRPFSSVQIREEPFAHTQQSHSGQALVEARPEAVRIQLAEIKQENLPEPVAEASVTKDKSLPQSQRSTSAKKRSTKKNTTTSTLSGNGRKAKSSKTKTKQTRKTSDQPPKSEGVDSNIEIAVRKAWSQSSKQPQLSNFFLHGVDESLAEIEHTCEIKVEHTSDGQSQEFKLGASIWLPGNSTIDVQSTLPQLEDSRETDMTRCDEIDPFTDLPPIQQHLMSQPPSSTNTHQHHSNTSALSADSDSEDTDIEEGEDGRESKATVVCDLEEEREEWEQDDQDALEDLAWELASTVECEGRLTRCESELDDSIEYRMGTPLLVSGGNDDMEDVMTTNVDIDQVMSDFELYQKQVMEYDSN